MLILALDTTTRAGSCALARDGAVMRELASDPGKSHAEHLPGDLMAVLEAARVKLAAIDVFGVATGPGSFTGLRVGIATMQGLAFAEGKPLIGVSALDALARAAGPAPEDRIATWIDAWRGEVYAALYENGHEVEPPTVEHPAAILERLGKALSRADREGPQYHGEGPYPHPGVSPRRVWFIGDGAASFTELIRATLGDRAVIAEPVAPLLAGLIAQLAHVSAEAGVRPSPDAIRPLYVRRTDAELARDARAGL